PLRTAGNQRDKQGCRDQNCEAEACLLHTRIMDSACRASASVGGTSRCRTHTLKQPRRPMEPPSQAPSGAWEHANGQCATRYKASLEVQHQAARSESRGYPANSKAGPGQANLSDQKLSTPIRWLLFERPAQPSSNQTRSGKDNVPPTSPWPVEPMP